MTVYSDEYRQARRVLFWVNFCTWCLRRGHMSYGPDGEKWNTDHVTPRSRGGSDDPRNLTRSCQTCNLRKSANEWTPPKGYITAYEVMGALDYFEWKCDGDHELIADSMEAWIERRHVEMRRGVYAQ